MGIARPHRLHGDHRVGKLALTRPQRQDRSAFAISQGGAEQAIQRLVISGGADNQVTELDAEQGVARIGEDIRCIAIMLDDAPGLVDPQEQRPGRGV